MFDILGGGMLTGAEIEKQIKKGNIHITPYDKKQLNPNSYNLRLHPELAVYRRGREDLFDILPGSEATPNQECMMLANSQLEPLDMKKANEVVRFNIPETGYMLKPGILYLGRTVERCSTDKFIPMLDGRSSGGRLGISIHICAGFGDIGFDGTWTLEITVEEPVIIYPDVEIAQVSYFKPYGKTNMLYNGRYNKQVETTASRFHQNKQEVYNK